MESLLRWGIENSTNTNDSPPQPRNDLDPAIIDHILGKSDAVLMKEALEVAVDEGQDEDTRVAALDNFEMLIETIDNANNVENMQMWKPLQQLLTSPSSTDGIRMQTLWVIGTTLQNNPAAQLAYLALKPIPTLLSFLSPSSHSRQTRSKAVYAISSLLKHNASAVAQFDEAGGWDILCASLEDSDVTVRRKIAFLLNTLLIPTLPVSPPSRNSSAPIHSNSHASMLADPGSTSTSAATLKAFEDHGVLAASVSALVTPVPHGDDGEQEGDIDFEEKILRLLYTYLVSCNGRLDEDVKRVLGSFIEKQLSAAGGEAGLGERWGLEAGEIKEFILAIK